MTTLQIWNNIIAYALQIGLLVGLGALTPPLLKLRTPRARLFFWQTLLVACLVLPGMQPWRQEVINVSSLTAPSAIDPVVAGTPSAHIVSASVSAPAHHRIPFTVIVLCLLASGMAIRLTWLGIGLARLAGYRRRGHELASDPVFRLATGVSARWLVSEEIPGPVTFGWRDPVVLLPARFPSLRTELREAILCHEMTHVERHDWMFTLAEEMVRAVFWFHPAIWWVLAEIQLAREQTVDEAVVEITHARGYYVDALLAIASPMSAADQLDLAPAPLFLRRRHLKRRVVELLQEVRMTPFSRLRFVLTQSAAVAVIASACWVASGAFPLAAAPQLVTDATGVVVNTGDAKLIHRTPVAYPPEALERGIQGSVIIQASIDADGQVSDDTVVRCPRELCDAAVDSLTNWRFDTRQANTTRAISIDFVKSAGAPFPETTRPAEPARTFTPPARRYTIYAPLYAQAVMPAAPGIMASTTVAQVPRGVPTFTSFTSRTVWMDGTYVIVGQPTAPNSLGHTLNDIRIAGLSDSAANQLKSRLPIQAGSVWSAATASIVSQAVAGFDPGLEVDIIRNPQPEQWILWIGPATPPTGNSAIVLPAAPPGVYLGGGEVRPPAVLSKFDPAYTDSAKSAAISGTVTLSMVVGADGTAQNIQVIGSLEPSLDQAAMDALAKWRFRPGTKDGAPVNTQAQVVLNFRIL